MTAEQLLVLPVLANLVGIFAAWLYYTRRKRWPERPVRRGNIYRCGACGMVYVDARDLPMAKCPKCGGFNEALRR